ncbi:hypothetical protein KUTeg_010070 [Tegillarca granosa]|uniref:Uncharacterized protein n=1 Tax=Tegillarca granosa TaxID=220873 RepID=A0ABQ9F5P2_TEGGR|nr:hypothetical protein KUTeg_010070 [Tegillarca granosa]
MIFLFHSVICKIKCCFIMSRCNIECFLTFRVTLIKTSKGPVTLFSKLCKKEHLFPIGHKMFVLYILSNLVEKEITRNDPGSFLYLLTSVKYLFLTSCDKSIFYHKI